MVDQIDVPKVNLYADVGGALGNAIVTKVTLYAIVNDDTPPPPPAPRRRKVNVAIRYGGAK
jgi:hypothetical protein